MYGESDDPAKMTDAKMAFSCRLPAVTILKDQICVHSYHLHDVEPMSVYHAEFLYAVMYAATLLCGCQKSGGSPITSAQVVRCAHIAAVKVVEIHETLQKALEAAEALRNPEQKKKRKGIGGDRPDGKAATTEEPTEAPTALPK